MPSNYKAYDNELLKQIDRSQKEIDDINLKATKEILKLEDKYNRLRKPLYKKRGEFIKRVKNFWGTSLKNYKKVSGHLEMEEECLRSITKLEVKVSRRMKSGYRINFHFDENPFFKNKVLTKEIRLRKAISTSTPIEWKEGQNLSSSFFDWYLNETNIDGIAGEIKDALWENPLYYYAIEVEPEDEVERNDDDESNGNGDDENNGNDDDK